MYEDIDKYNQLDNTIKAKQEEILSNIAPHKPEIGNE